MLPLRSSHIGCAGAMMANPVRLSGIEQQVLAQLEGHAAIASCDACAPFGVLAASWKLGTVHQLVNALLTLVDKGLLRQCDTLSFGLTVKGRAALRAVRAESPQDVTAQLPQCADETSSDLAESVVLV
ncbi:hypothetical protein [Dyella flagellata]|uniref:MarR family transcriptional regulator n=1 Tax=Dyella flagellata TaxID=1867833 RepID=A0ABQ5X6W5_9GAMM|nr:hypothetical protein [Dyella flagellata]GLQ87355.1 hypothetical protein GCM10007898_09210 [Dyella flagellata]